MTEKPESVEQLSSKAVRRMDEAVSDYSVRLQDTSIKAARERMRDCTAEILVIPEDVEAAIATMQPTEKQQHADDAHRERVKVALVELRAEAERLSQLRGGEQLSFSHVASLGSSSLVSRQSHGVLVGQTNRLGVSAAQNWTVAHDAIARANNLPTLAELADEPETDFAQLQQAMDEYGSGKSRDVQEIIDEFERELASKVICAIEAELSQRGIPSFAFDAVKFIIAKARQAEREELRRLKDELESREQQLSKIADDRDGWRTVARANADALADKEVKLTAAEARVRELEGQIKIVLPMIERVHRELNVAFVPPPNLRQSPATADAKGERETNQFDPQKHRLSP